VSGPTQRAAGGAGGAAQPAGKAEPAGFGGDDLIVEGAAVLTVDPEWRIFEPGYVAVKDGRITAAGPAAEAAGRSAARRIDARGRLLMPGFVNTHTHVPMSAFRGAGEDMPDRLLRFIFPLERDLVRPDLVYWSSLFCLTEMALSGTTTFADMYYFEDEVAKATEKAGMRALLGETILGQPTPDAATPEDGIAYARDFIAKWKGADLIKPMIAPHAPYTVDASLLARLRDDAERLDVDLMMHIAEMDFETKKLTASHGSVMKYLDSIEGFLSPRLIGVHMIFLDDDDIRLAAKSGMRFAHCPASNAKSGRPISPAWRLREAGVPLGLATDGPLSGNGMDMQGVLNLFPKLQKVREGRRELLPAREALRAATLGGAEALRMETVTGSIEAGKDADFILVDLDAFNLQPVYDWYSTAVYALRPQNVESVFVKGRQIVAERRMTGFDQDEAMAKMTELRRSCAAYLAGA
jgi:cytosine/adenosine deaminase-related metal-dependent hydrolase